MRERERERESSVYSVMRHFTFPMQDSGDFKLVKGDPLLSSLCWSVFALSLYVCLKNFNGKSECSSKNEM